MNIHPAATAMRQENHTHALAVILALSLACWVLGWLAAGPVYLSGGTAGFGYVLFRAAGGYRLRRSARAAGENRPLPRPARPTERPKPANPHDPGALADEMLAQGRCALLLRPQIAGNLPEPQFRRALASLNETMALVPEGDVALEPASQSLDFCRLDADDALHIVRVAPVFLDRYPVTNRQFYEFVAGGGYEQVALWDTAIWTAVLAMTDRTGRPGPRYWMDGVYLEGEEDHPVVGVSWYEAAAFARWIGKRLPSDAEWVKAGTWPLPTGGGVRSQRRYPWGDTVDRGKANLWGSGPERIVSVREFTEGVSVGGVYQLIGNVWEWTSGTFRGIDGPDGRLEPAEPMKSLRGGAFDTYFDNQATCQFRSGDYPLRRKHNIGFRCAVGVCDLLLARARGIPECTAAGQPEPPGNQMAGSAECESAEQAQEVHS
ncbi:MAG: SUMF1/EgtB/PvdO family nonheme iron enzyme [Thermoguttaceae bacterium]|jgi:iron(II)-dependent oxidoreductase|nr:SUMF1/EgtB/PvdO family nonheme iron enzyme [Thermoguttaceae bacterium]